MDKSWASNENNSDAQDCTAWQVLIGWNTSSINATLVFQFNNMLSHRRSMPRHCTIYVNNIVYVNSTVHVNNTTDPKVTTTKKKNNDPYVMIVFINNHH